ncbi:DNA-binding response regulator [Brevundimonas intermedia]|jgi:FixJ family two-component response regulator|uniref:DNA-binding response regulator n=1 Tax=Brevundimonas intermedia TaxID=74315 RepID=A0ABQ5T789_9CAUL|nr:response regulator transcription factor [Brevundimonas intermedia]GLK48273.1 DNA-binding response regulator [Brevundimonas intermedia]
MSSEPVIHIVDDDQSVREAVKSLMESVGLSACAYRSTQDFLDARRWSEPGCVLLDVRLPGGSGLEFHARMASLGVFLPVIFMTGHGDIPMSVQGMKGGAVDFLTKPFRDQDLLDAVATALDRDRARRASEISVGDLRRRYETLSQREREVMRLVATGKMNKQVAGDLEISEVTVKIHRGSAMRKMGARTLPDLVRMADLLAGSTD